MGHLGKDFLRGMKLLFGGIMYLQCIHVQAINTVCLLFSFHCLLMELFFHTVLVLCLRAAVDIKNCIVISAVSIT